MPRRARSYGGNRVISRSPNVIFPERIGKSAMMLSIVVVLPAPFRPTRQTVSPVLTANEIP